MMEYGPVDGGWSMDDEKQLTFAIFKDHNQLLYLFWLIFTNVEIQI